MERFIRLAKSLHFELISDGSSRPLVVHSYPGCGKSHLIRSFLAVEPNSSAITFGEADPVNLSGRRIRKPPFLEDSGILLVDEYLGGVIPPEASVLLCDPLQYPNPSRRADLICKVTKRFGQNTCELLKALKVDISSEKEDSAVVQPFYGSDPIGKVICFQSEVEAELGRHSVDFCHPCDIRGAEFEGCTVALSCELTEVKEFDKLFISLTRHRSKLLVLTPEGLDPRLSTNISDALGSSN